MQLKVLVDWWNLKQHSVFSCNFITNFFILFFILCCFDKSHDCNSFLVTAFLCLCISYLMNIPCLIIQREAIYYERYSYKDPMSRILYNRDGPDVRPFIAGIRPVIKFGLRIWPDIRAVHPNLVQRQRRKRVFALNLSYDVLMKLRYSSCLQF